MNNPNALKEPVSQDTLIIISLLLPVIAYVAATVINPSGFLSSMPTIYGLSDLPLASIQILLSVISGIFWSLILSVFFGGPILGALVVLLFIIAYGMSKRPSLRGKYHILLFIAMVFYSLFLFWLVATTQEHEFTG